MSTQFLVSTTGTLNPVPLNDLGIQVDHPTVDRDFLLEFSSDEIANSSDLQAAITAGHLTAKDENAAPITTVGVSVHIHSNKAQLDLVTDGDHDVRTDNPHGVTKSQVSLGNVTNDAQLKRAAGDFASFTAKTTPVANDIILIEDSADSNNKKKVVWSSLPVCSCVFGTQYNFGESDSESSTTSTSWQTKLTLTTGSLPIGTYRVSWYFETATATSGYGPITRVYLDSSTSIGDSYFDFEWVDNRLPISGWSRVSFASASTHTIAIQYKSCTSGYSVKIRRARLDIWRIS